MNDKFSDDAEKRRLEEAEDVRAVVAAIATEGGEVAALAALSGDSRSFTSTFQVRSFEELPHLRTFQGGQIRIGGAGVVVQCEDPRLNRKYALKVLRPSQLGLDFSKLSKDLEAARREAVRGAMLTHINVAFLAGVDRLALPLPAPPGTDSFIPKVDTTVSLVEWIDEATPFADYVYEKCSTVNHLVGLIQQVLRGIEHIHSKGLVHWDVKSANCLVNGQGIVKIVDIGNARNLRGKGDRYESEERALTSRENFPIGLEGSNEELAKDSRRITVVLRAKEFTKDRMWWDLCMAGRMLSRILGFEDERDEDSTKRQQVFSNRVFKPSDEDSQMALQFLSRICGRLVKSIDKKGDPETNRYYTSASEVLSDLDKLLPEFGAAGGIPELHEIQQHVVRIPTTRNAPFSRRVNLLANSLPMKRLRNCHGISIPFVVYLKGDR